MVSYLEAFEALNCPWMLAYAELLSKCLMFECYLNVSILWVTLEAFDALNVPWMLA